MAKSPSGKKGSRKNSATGKLGRAGAAGKAVKGGKAPAVSAPQPSQPIAEKSKGQLRRILSRRPWWKRVGKWIAVVAAVLIALPVLFTLIYASSSVHPVSTLMLSKRVTGEIVKRDWVAFDAIAPVVWQSVMMSEDGQFCSHHGVDWDQMNIVIDDALGGEPVRGASTITMQVVKNVYLWPSRSYIRKVLEVPLAMLVELVWSKRRIMEVYLNIAEWGPGVFGIEAAARTHFKRSAKKVSRQQAALLAVTLPNPIKRNPRKASRGMKRLAKLVERRGRASGAYIGCLR